MLEIMVNVENLYLTDPQFGNPKLEEIIKSLVENILIALRIKLKSLNIACSPVQTSTYISRNAYSLNKHSPKPISEPKLGKAQGILT